MSEYTESIKKAADSLELAEQEFTRATNRLATVRGHNGQSGYSVTVNGVTVAVSQCDRKTYQGTLIRGREMIHLGALKALGAEVQASADRVRDCRAYLASIVIS